MPTDILGRRRHAVARSVRTRQRLVPLCIVLALAVAAMLVTRIGPSPVDATPALFEGP